MSDIRTMHRTCPKCQKESDITYFSSVNVSLDPELKKQIMDSSFFKWECPHCHTTVDLVYGFLYHDMDKRLMIFYDPVKTADSKAEFDMSALGPISGMEDYKYRIVYGLANLQEKLRIFDDGLDEIAMELTKYVALKNPSLKGCEIHYLAHGAEDILFSYYNPADGKTGGFKFPYERYEFHVKAIKAINTFAIEVGKCVEVDVNWIDRNLELFKNS